MTAVMDREERIARLRQELDGRVLVLDGAMGTGIQDLGLTAADFGGEEYEGCNEHLNLTCPGAILDIHQGFLEAGADILETNSFGSTPLVLAEYDLAEKARAISRAAAALAREVADRCPDRERVCFVQMRAAGETCIWRPPAPLSGCTGPMTGRRTDARNPVDTPLAVRVEWPMERPSSPATPATVASGGGRIS